MLIPCQLFDERTGKPDRERVRLPLSRVKEIVDRDDAAPWIRTNDGETYLARCTLDEIDRAVAQIVPATPGYSAITEWEDSGGLHILLSPIVAWRLDRFANEPVCAGGGWEHGPEYYVDDFSLVFEVDPSGAAEAPLAMDFDEWLHNRMCKFYFEHPVSRGYAGTIDATLIVPIDDPNHDVIEQREIALHIESLRTFPMTDEGRAILAQSKLEV